jgi:SAM-dependent methyltransferase
VDRQYLDDDDRLQRRFEIERELAGRLRGASKEQRRALYSEVYREFYDRVDLPGDAEAQRQQVPLLIQLLEPFLGGVGSFLEIGAGRCDLSREIATRVGRVWAVDAVEPEGRAEEPPVSFEFVHADRLSEVIPHGSVDLALSCHLVEHLHPEDLADHLAEVLRLLAPGGAYVVVTPSRLYGPHDVSGVFGDDLQGFHLFEYLHADLAARMRRAGFRRVGAIRRLGVRPSRGALSLISAVERVADALPVRARRALAARAPREAPFRPLEQVKLVGRKPG